MSRILHVTLLTASLVTIACAHSANVGCSTFEQAVAKARYVATQDWQHAGVGPMAEKYPGDFDTGCTMDLECTVGSANLELVEHDRVIRGKCDCCTILYFTDAPTNRGGKGVLHAFVLHWQAPNQDAANKLASQALTAFAPSTADVGGHVNEDFTWLDTPRRGITTFASTKVEAREHGYHVFLYVSQHDEAPPN